jgi:hypothetical protein
MKTRNVILIISMIIVLLSFIMFVIYGIKYLHLPKIDQHNYLQVFNTSCYLYGELTKYMIGVIVGTMLSIISLGFCPRNKK